MTQASDKGTRSIYKATIISLVFLLSPFVKAADERLVGSDGGSISVGNSGQAVWSMPVEVPSGINGVAPNLALSVSTSGGNGPLGVGGGLSGLSSISRCGRTIYQDGYFQAPQYEQSDAYCLDGARLVLESGTYGGSGSVYRTEIESFQRIRAHNGIAGKGPAYFEVTNRSGATMIYGQRAGTQDIDAASGAVAVWKIDKLIDSNTNTLRYHYADVSGNNEVQLSHISYGGNTTENVSEHLSIELIYENRPDTSTISSRGQQYSQTKRVSGIQTKVGTTVVKDYRLTYEQGVVTGASRLASVQLCAGNGDCYRPSTFEYAPETQNNWTPSALSLPAQVQTSDGKPLGTLADINNDGRSDWISASRSGTGTIALTTYLGGQSGWQESAALTLPDVLFDYSENTDGFTKGALLDINGDGWPDYVKAYQTDSEQVVQTWRNTGGEFVRDESLDLPVALVSMASDGTVRSLADLADLNADGLVDVIESVNLNGTPVLRTWMHQEEEGVHSWQESAAYQAPSIATDYTQGREGRVLATLQDVNADGLSDWVTSYRINNTSINQTWINTGQGWQSSNEFVLPVALFNYDLGRDGVAEYTLTDLNGDGLPDLSKALNINGSNEFDSWVHNGLTWLQDSDYNLPGVMTMVADNGNAATVGGLLDLDSDGQPDFVQSYTTATTTVEGFWLFDKASKSWNLSDDYDLPFINNRIQSDGTSLSAAEVADLNHDGYPELLDTLSGAVFETSAGSHYPGTLIRTINPLGAATEIMYGISTDPNLYELAPQSSYPNIAYNAPVRVIKEVAASNGIGGMISAYHTYGRAKTNVLGQGGLGYQYHGMQDSDSGVQVLTTFHQSYPYAGRIKASSKFLDGNSLSVSNSDMQMHDITINGLTTLYPHPGSSVAEAYDLDGTLLKITRSSSQIDGFGNSTISKEEIFDASDVLVRRSTSTVTYKAPDLSRWLFGLPEKTSQTLFDRTSNETYTNEAVATFASDGKPLTETLEPTSDQWVRKSYTYDNFGNRLTSSVTAAGITDPRTSTTTYTSDGRFPQTISNTLNHTISTVFDPILGKPESVTDANGLMKEFLYDGFGTTLREDRVHQSAGATRGKQIVIPKWCSGNPDASCPAHAVYFIFAMDDEGGSHESAYYDVNGKELRKQTSGFEGKPIVVETEYGANGKVARITQPYYRDEETPTWTSYEYDVLGREKKRTNAEGRKFYTSYNGFEVSTTNPGNDDTPAQTTRVIQNIFGQPIESIDPDNNSTFYEYDGRGKLIKTIDAKNNVATITYDTTFGRKVAMNDPDLGEWSYEYDALGNLIAQTDANNQRTTMEYDQLNRLVHRVDDAGGPKEEVTSWEYSNTRSDGNIIGGLKNVISPNFRRDVKYDEFSRVTEAISQIDGKSFTQRTGYLGTADKVDWIEYPSGLSVRNTYDDYGFPATVEGITLDYDKYIQFQTASRELNDLQRQLESYKDERLSDAQLYQLEEHERQVRLLGGALSDFYDEFDDNPEKARHESEAEEYSTLVERVQTKITQHTNWHNHYQKELDRLYKKIKPDIERQEAIRDEIEPHQAEYDRLRPSYDSYINEANRYQRHVTSWQGKVNTEATNLNNLATQINANVQTANNQMTHVHNLIRSLLLPQHAARYINGDVTQLFRDFDCCTEHVINNFSKTSNPDLINSHLTQMSNYLTNYAAAGERIERLQAQRQEVQGRFDYNKGQLDHYVWRVNQEVGKADGVANQMKPHTDAIEELVDEDTALASRVEPHADRISDWLSPIVKSHSNILLSFNDRARAHVGQISLRTGSYAKRSDLRSEQFLKPFKNHVEYIRCLRDQSAKSIGDCYAENLVHVLKDDGTVDTAKQAEARADIEDDTRIDIRQFWSNNRFFCSAYYGYSCPSKYRTEIIQMVKTLHTRQCARMTDKQKEDSNLTCTKSEWNDDYAVANSETDERRLRYPYLADSVVDFSSNLANYYGGLVTRHQAEVERLVTNATRNTYNEESRYADIVQLGGNLWQASRPTPVAEDETDPREYVLLYKGRVQALAYAQQNTLQRQANRELRGHQRAIADLINDGQSGNYDALYLAVQEKAEEANRLYKEIDQDYALASNDDDFDDDDFQEAKKIYWQAQDINSKGQIKKAKYGNGTVTEWTYDQFGRINSHITKGGAANQTLLNNQYRYDAIGNLTQRIDSIEDVTEDFSYDVMNRLVRSDLSGTGTAYVAQVNGDVVNYNYDELGNLIYKSDIHGGGTNGRYTYGSTSSGSHAGPHAVTHISGLGNFSYDNNGNQLTGNDRNMVYNAFNKPTSIVKGGKQTEMWYGPERQMIKQREDTPSGRETTLYVGGLFEEIAIQGGGVTNRHHIAVAGNAIAVVETTPGSLVATKEHYLHKNHQSSVLAITDIDGEVTERRYYDAFGDIKSYIGQASRQYASWIGFASVTNLGFTGHRTLVAAGVIHMGGRVYDAQIGRFLSADPHIQSPLNSQSLNRYSYTLNNPLSWTDPSGYFFSSLFKALKKLFDKIKAIIKKVLAVVKKVIKAIGKAIKKIGQFIKKYYRVIVAVVVAVVVSVVTLGAAAAASWGPVASAIAAGAAGGAASGLILTGSLKGALQGALFGAVTGGIAQGLSGIGNGIARAIGAGQRVAGGINAFISGGVISKLTGGSFSKGALGGLIGFAVFSAVASIGFVKRGLAKLDAWGRSLINRPGIRSSTGLSASDDVVGKEFSELTPEEQLEFHKDLREAKRMSQDALFDRIESGETVLRADTVDGAAERFAEVYEPITRKTGIEIGAAIRPSGAGGYYVSSPTFGNYKSVMPPLFADAAAYAHTHPSRSFAYASGFSLGDVKFRNSEKVPLYMADKNGLRMCFASSTCNVGYSPGVPVGN